MRPFSRGMLSLISPIDFPSYKSEEEIEKMAWQIVGDCLRTSLDAMGKRKNTRKPLKTRPNNAPDEDIHQEHNEQYQSHQLVHMQRHKK